MSEKRIEPILESWMEETSLHDHYLIFEIGEKESRLSVVGDNGEEYYSSHLDTSNYKNLDKKTYLFPMIRNTLLTKLMLEEEAA